MLDCVPPRYRLLDLAFALCGAAAFLTDLASDVWSTWRLYTAGDAAWAAVYLGLYVVSSSVLQLLSWGWYWADRQDSEPGNAGDVKRDAALKRGDTDYAACCSVPANGAVPGAQHPECAAVPSAVDAPAVGDPGSVPLATLRPAASHIPPQDCRPAATPGCCGAHPRAAADGLLLGGFCTSTVILRPSCLTLLHVLQLGYPLRCVHSLEVGIAAYRNPEDETFKDYAYFLTHDISMMRLMETFLENTPQLILMLYIIIQREAIQTFQCVSISVSFICISWAILDYHQSLRLFLKGKHKLSILSSAIYYLWNFCLISSRILCVTLFTVTLHWMIAVHFIFLWSAFFLWATLQKTIFMKHKCLEIVYRATVAIVLYFSWFNIADGRTLYRCLVYHVFIITDSVILVGTWLIYKSPSILDGYETFIIVTNVVFFAVGLGFRFLYYKCLHPNVISETEQYYDVPDGIKEAGTNIKLLLGVKDRQKTNDRMTYLAMLIY